MEKYYFIVIVIISWVIQILVKKQRKAKNEALLRKPIVKQNDFDKELNNFSEEIVRLMRVKKTSESTTKSATALKPVIHEELQKESTEKGTLLDYISVSKRKSLSKVSKQDLKRGVILKEILERKF